MASHSRNEVSCLGFLTVLDKPRIGYIGGYLVLNALARPIEFHCTAPVVPNRAQQILYGLTLAPYLYGEQIGVALVERSKVLPQLLVTDCPEILQARGLYDAPILLLHDEATTGDRGFTLPGADDATACYFSTHHEHASDRPTAEAFSAAQTNGMDWHEPFERIRDAISEAQRPAAA